MNTSGWGELKNNENETFSPATAAARTLSMSHLIYIRYLIWIHGNSLGGAI